MKLFLVLVSALWLATLVDSTCTPPDPGCGRRRRRSESLVNFYDRWSSEYDANMERDNYNGPRHVVEAFVELGLDHSVRILDILAGTGLVAHQLKSHGYKNVDGIDGSPGMRAVAKKKHLYKHYYTSLLGGNHIAPIDDETYDVLIASGSFAPDHLDSKVFPDLLRMTKKGGIIIWNVFKDSDGRGTWNAQFENDVEALVSKGVWRHYRTRKDIDQYLGESDGNVYSMQKM